MAVHVNVEEAPQKANDNNDILNMNAAGEGEQLKLADLPVPQESGAPAKADFLKGDSNALAQALDINVIVHGVPEGQGVALHGNVHEAQPAAWS